MRSARHGRLGVEPRVPDHRYRLDARARLLRRQHMGVRASRASIRGFVRAPIATCCFPHVATVDSSPGTVRADSLLLVAANQVRGGPEALPQEAGEEDGSEETRARDAQEGRAAGGRVDSIPREADSSHAKKLSPERGRLARASREPRRATRRRARSTRCEIEAHRVGSCASRVTHRFRRS